MSVSDYTAKIKSIYDLLGSININIDEDEMVEVCLGGLVLILGRTSHNTRCPLLDTPPKGW